jgi:hypothetical protein
MTRKNLSGRPLYAGSIRLLFVRPILWTVLLPWAVLFSASCGFVLSPEQDTGHASLLVKISSSSGLSSSWAHDITSVDIAGSGPAGGTFSANGVTGQKPVLVTVSPGNWDISVHAKNSANTLLGEGVSRVTVTAGTQVSAVVLLRQVFSVGDIGPSGGYVFYDKGIYSDGWRYLEAAPSDWAGGIDPDYPWDESEYGEIGTYTAIGMGYDNTVAITAALSEHTGDYAAGVAAGLSITAGGSVYSDWFLPSLDELTLMYTNLYAPGHDTSYFGGNYWSSSEQSGTTVWVINFATGDTTTFEKSYTPAPIHIRPARRF